LSVTPGDSGSARIHPCSVIAKSRYPGHVDQSYAFRVTSAVDVPIRAASSSGARTAAIILRVQDRSVEGADIPDDPNTVDCWYPDVLEGVPASVRGPEDGLAAWRQIDYPFVLIGTTEVPASSSAITKTTFRGTAINARSDYADPVIYQPQRRFSVGHTGSYFEDFSDPLYFDVPEWAAWVTFQIHISGLHVAGGNSYGMLSAFTMDRALKYTRWNIDLSDGGNRSSWMVVGKVYVSEKYRGKTQSLKLRVSNQLQSAGATVTLDERSSVAMNVSFQEATQFAGE